MMRPTSRTVVGLIVAVAATTTCCDMVSSVSAQQSGARLRRRGAVSFESATGEALPGTTGQKRQTRMREGVLVEEQLGTFQVAGDRITLKLPDQEQPIVILENLALERVWKVLDDTRGRQWVVSGRVTEYRGKNFLILHRAVLRSEAAKAFANP